MNKVAVMQPYIFPYIGYFQVVNAVDEYVIYDDVQYIKGGWINRNNVLIGQQKTLFTISLADASANKLINEIEIKDDFTKLLKTISMAYSRAPYKDPIYQLVSKICAYENKNLARFIGNSIQEIAGYLSINTRLIYSSDLRIDTRLHAQDRIVEICKLLKADTYINAIGGQGLYSPLDFKSQGVELKFLKADPISYKQSSKEFVPWLSIVDILMFNSIPEVQKMLNKYTLI